MTSPIHVLRQRWRSPLARTRVVRVMLAMSMVVSVQTTRGGASTGTVSKSSRVLAQASLLPTTAAPGAATVSTVGKSTTKKKTTKKTTKKKVTKATLLPGTAGTGVPTLNGASNTATTIEPGCAPTTTAAPKPTIATTTTTLPTAPLPAAANATFRPTFASIEPYRGYGAFVDRFDWTTRWSGKATPPVNVATMDVMAAAGIETVYIQAAHWASNGVNDVLEPDKLLPMIDRAHALGMHVVVWYLPGLQDMNTDLRRTIAIANLDVDGIAIDLEDNLIVPEVGERTRRAIAYSQQLRALMPGRFLAINIVEPILMDPAPDIWPQADGTFRAKRSYWRGPFPYAQLAPSYDLWMVQTYWTNSRSDSGWRDGYRYVIESVRRLRAATGRPDLPVHVSAGVGDRMTCVSREVNNISGFSLAAREVGAVGVSMYDWVTWRKTWHAFLLDWRRKFRDAASTGVPDTFTPVAMPTYVPTVQPVITTPPVGTTTTTLVPVLTVPVATIAPTPDQSTTLATVPISPAG